MRAYHRILPKINRLPTTLPSYNAYDKFSCIQPMFSDRLFHELLFLIHTILQLNLHIIMNIN